MSASTEHIHRCIFIPTDWFIKY